MREINVEEYCERVSSECDKEKANVVSEQVLEAIGGLANLYLEAALKQGTAQLEVETWKTFACKYVNLSIILKEIGNSAGTGWNRSKIIYRGMQKVLEDFFRKYEIFEFGEPVVFKPLGRFQVIDLKKSLYFLTYSDPAVSHYRGFLLSSLMEA